MSERLCLHCGKPLTRRPNEDHSDFLRRRYCGRDCAGRHSGEHFSARAKLQHKRKSKAQREQIADVKAKGHATVVAKASQLAPGTVESIDAYLARGGRITQCPSAYAAPVEHAMAEFGRRVGGRRG